MLGGILALLVRTELAARRQYYSGTEYNRLFTMHATIMIFLWVIPVLAGLLTYIVPLQIGANDMAFPKLNAVSFWLIVIGGLLLCSSFLVGAP
ncbi:cbb3-type cytochrome c oxidase subunit I [Candidatus Amarolinea dominans]|uniref:cbb3-type cytochrome c oxidase subunit I n=1 Tax=Candidatus Amarolinea dominans TaxID=3140696 RepID=UPI0031CC54C0